MQDYEDACANAVAAVAEATNRAEAKCAEVIMKAKAKAQRVAIQNHAAKAAKIFIGRLGIYILTIPSVLMLDRPFIFRPP